MENNNLSPLVKADFNLFVKKSAQVINRPVLTEYPDIGAVKIELHHINIASSVALETSTMLLKMASIAKESLNSDELKHFENLTNHNINLFEALQHEAKTLKNLIECYNMPQHSTFTRRKNDSKPLLSPEEINALLGA